MPASHRIVQSGVALSISHINRRGLIEQHLRDLHMSVDRSEVDWKLLVEGRDCQLGSALEQHFDDLIMALSHSQVQGCAIVIVALSVNIEMAVLQIALQDITGSARIAQITSLPQR